MLHWTIVILCVCLVVKAPTVDGAVNHAYYLRFAYDCDKSEAVMDYQGIGAFFYSLRMDVDERITNDYKMQIDIDRWNNGDWESNFFNFEKGPACEVLKSNGCGLCKLWNHFRSEIRPPIKEMCVIEPGHYEIKNFEADHSDLPWEDYAPKGTYKSTLRLYDEYDNLVLCQVFEVEID